MFFYRSNLLGHKGEVAEEFGIIMKALWNGQYKCISPRDFKRNSEGGGGKEIGSRNDRQGGRRRGERLRTHSEMREACKLTTDCLKSFSKEEKLTDNNRFYCSNCKTRRDSTKKIEIWKLPPVLLVHLKR
ncbi:hypothetical protein AB205_0036480 [Aquarana catesbeiana]|uniref:USP domain-containing protein n=1 Tax=Aquarana catesbeiana TaxID=8400 RepID=A0A2G9R8I0_AQUCT|nr:hypothetical protein AB205_0036480 [Aquarana catesbeiana]